MRTPLVCPVALLSSRHTVNRATALSACSQPGPRRLFSRALFAALAALCLYELAGVALQAQTAHPGGVVTLGSGFSTPTGVTVDGSGNVYVADNGNSAVKKIVAVNGRIPVTPVINTLGSGFANPFTVAVDASGNVVVTDYGNHAVKEILAAGGYTTIRTLAGGLSFIFGTAVDSHGNVFFSEYGKNNVDEILAVNGVIPPAPKMVIIGSGFNIPAGLAVDASGNVFVGDQNNNAVKEILASSGYATTITVAATGFSVPDGVAVDGSGNVYVADDGNNAVKEVLAVNGVIPPSPTIVPLGSGFLQPFDVAVDGSGNVYVADRGNNAVKEIQAPGANLGQVALGTTTVAFPVVFTFDTGGTLGSTAVVTLGNAGMDFKDAGGGTCIASTVYSAGQSCTVNVKFGPLAPGARYGAVKLLGTTGVMLATSPLQGIGVGPQANFAVTTSGVSLPSSSVKVGSGFSSPGGAAVDASGNIFIADSFNGAVKEIMASGGWTTVNILGASFDNPNGVAIDGGGNVYVADTLNNAVEELVAAGNYSTVKTLGSGFSSPYAVAVDGFGNVYVANYSPGTVQEMMAIGGSIPASPSIRTIASGLNGPDGLAVDGNGNVFVAAYGDGTVREIHAVNGAIPPVIPGSPVFPGSPVITTVASGFSGPSNLSVDGAGNVFVSDTDDGKVDELVAAGGYTTLRVLGGTFSAPEATAVWQNGDVIVADAGTNAVTLLDFADPSALSFPATAVGSTSSAQTVTVSNDGNAPLIFPLPGSGTNPSVPANFAWDSSSTCLQTTPASSQAFSIAGGTSCGMAVTFKPTTTGALSGNAVLTDNNLNLPNSTQSIHLSGTGTPSAALTSPTPKTALAGPKVTFTWSTATGATGYGFRLGTSVGENNLFAMGTTTATSAVVSNLPTNGERIYARLSTMYGASQVNTDYVFTAATRAVLTGISPVSGVRGASVNVALKGTNLTGATAVTAPNQPTITVSNLHVASPTEVLATLTLAPTTTLGAHTISVVTPAGTATIAFTVLGGPVASPGQLQVLPPAQLPRKD